MRLVILEAEILIMKPEDVAHRGIDMHPGQWISLARDLLARLFAMIEIEMRITEGVHEFARRMVRHLGHHQRHARIRGDIKAHAQTAVGRAAIKLTRKTTMSDIDVEQAMAR